MELKPFEKLVKYIAIDQLTQVGWVDIIRIPIEDSDTLTPDQIQEGVEEVMQMLYKNDKAHLSVQGKAVCIKGLDQSGTFRVYASSDQRVDRHDKRIVSN
jgi:hypothetical protein